MSQHTVFINVTVFMPKFRRNIKGLLHKIKRREDKRASGTTLFIIYSLLPYLAVM